VDLKVSDGGVVRVTAYIGWETRTLLRGVALVPNV